MPNNRQDAFLLEGPSGLSAINTDLLSGQVNGWFDLGTEFSSVTLQVTTTAGISAGAVLFEGTNDITDATASAGITIPMISISAVGSTNISASALTLAASTTVVYEAKVATRWVRLRISTGVTGGTVKCSAFFQQSVSHKATYPQFSSPFQGVSSHALTSAATTNATSVKTSAGSIVALALSNLSAATKFVKIYNKASAPTVGTDVPVITVSIPATTTIFVETGVTGIRLATGIAYAITGAVTDADTTAVAAGDVKVMMNYI